MPTHLAPSAPPPTPLEAFKAASVAAIQTTSSISEDRQATIALQWLQKYADAWEATLAAEALAADVPGEPGDVTAVVHELSALRAGMEAAARRKLSVTVVDAPIDQARDAVRQARQAVLSAEALTSMAMHLLDAGEAAVVEMITGIPPAVVEDNADAGEDDNADAGEDADVSVDVE